MGLAGLLVPIMVKSKGFDNKVGELFLIKYASSELW